MKLDVNKNVMALFLTSSLVFSLGIFNNNEYVVGEDIDYVIKKEDDYLVKFTDGSSFLASEDEKVRVMDKEEVRNLSIFCGLLGMTTSAILLKKKDK